MALRNRLPGAVAAAASLVGCALIPAMAQRPGIYRDPQGRFTVQIPAGWNSTQLNGDAVQFASGSAYVTAMVLTGGNPTPMMDAIARQTGQQWRNFAEARRGDAKFAGRAGTYATYSGANPKGVDSYLQLLAASDGSSTYLLMTSAPKADFVRLRSAFDQIEQSFTLSTAAKAPADLPPPPAGAIGKSPGAIGKSGPAVRSAPPPAPAPSTARVSAPAASSGGNYLRMKMVRIVDEHGFERPMAALTLLIPSDWQFQGNVQYGQAAGCHADLVRLAFRAVSPDGKFALELLPGGAWQWADDANAVRMMQASNQRMAQVRMHGCDVRPPMTAADFIRQTVVPAARRQARVTGVEPLSDVQQQLQEQVRQAEQAAARQGIPLRIRADVARARLSYSLGAEPVEEWITALTVSRGTPGPAFNMGRVGQTMYYTCGGDHVFGFRAPQGQLDAQEKLFRLLLSTVHVDPQWQGRVMQVIAGMQAKDSQGVADRTKIIAKSGQDISNIMNQTFENTNKSQDRNMEGWSQYMRGVATYRNPNTGETVELSNQYSHAWAGPNNEYIVTDSANFNPNVSLHGDWTHMELKQP